MPVTIRLAAAAAAAAALALATTAATTAAAADPVPPARAAHRPRAQRAAQVYVGGGVGVGAAPAPYYAPAPQPVYAQPQPQVYSPGFMRDGIYYTGRIGGGWAFSSAPAARDAAPGAWASVGVGLQSRFGFAFGLTAGTRYHGSPSFGVFNFDLGVSGRFSGFPRWGWHPYTEVTLAFHVPMETHPQSAVYVGWGGSLTGGLEFDITPHFAIDVALRGDLFANTEVNPTAWFAITPFIGVTLYPSL